METNEEGNKKHIPKKQLKKDSPAYLRLREKRNAYNRKYRDKMTDEQKEILRAKGREYYYIKKAEKNFKKFNDFDRTWKASTKEEVEKGVKKVQWKEEGVIKCSHTPPLQYNKLTPRNLVRRQVGRKIAKKDRVKLTETFKKTTEFDHPNET